MMQPRTAGAIAVVASLLAALAGCSSGTDQKTSNKVDRKDLVLTTPAGSKKVDRVTWGTYAGEPYSIDPVRIGSDSEFLAVSNLCDSLLRVQPDFSVKPGLAKSAAWTSDTKFVIDLRGGVVFWDGTPLTAEDVAFSLKRSANPKSQSVQTQAFTNVKSINVTGPLQVTIDFKQHDSQFQNSMAGPAGYVFSKSFTQRVGEQKFGTASGGIMCTGPFKLERWKSGTSITEVANDQYWDGKPLIGTLELRFFDNDSTLVNALQAGEIDGAFDVPTQAVKRLSTSGLGSLFLGPSTASIGFGALSPQGPAGDRRVRQALDLAIDKKAFIKAVAGGYGEPLKALVPPFAAEGLKASDVYSAGYKALPSDDLDLERAKKLIAEAKLSSKAMNIVVPAGDQVLAQTAVIVQAAGKTLGLDIKIKQLQPTDFGRVFVDPTARKGYDLVATRAYQTEPGVLTFASLFMLPDGYANYLGYNNPEVTKLLSEARQNTDPTKSAEAFVKAQALYTPEKMTTPLAVTYTRVFLSNKLTGMTTSFAYTVSPWALHLGGK
ncbi:ABC transporter substrate-binding protein [Streptomyces sp. NPDC056390]|uniref:ABC transporter substrate-binding protein n=1 Tax=Streptomyces sp. NPDC056390 TaxID=3345806 RepID=UPI0035E17557